jgi:hypothetical protein
LHASAAAAACCCAWLAGRRSARGALRTSSMSCLKTHWLLTGEAADDVSECCEVQWRDVVSRCHWCHAGLCCCCCC